MLTENTEVVLVGFPDPFQPNARDFTHRCALKDSLSVMDERLSKLDFEKEGIIYYQFSVLLVDEERNYKLVYSYNGDKDIHINADYEGLVAFDDGQTQYLPNEQWLPYPGGRLIIREIEKSSENHTRRI